MLYFLSILHSIFIRWTLMKLRRANKIVVTIETLVFVRCDLRSETNTRNRIRECDGKETKKRNWLNWYNRKTRNSQVFNDRKRKRKLKMLTLIQCCSNRDVHYCFDFITPIPYLRDGEKDTNKIKTKIMSDRETEVPKSITLLCTRK